MEEETSGGDAGSHAAQARLAALSMEDAKIDPRRLLDAFDPEATSQARTQAIVKLFALQQTSGDETDSNNSLSSQVRPILESALADLGNVRSCWAATRLLTALCSVASTCAHELLFSQDRKCLLSLVLRRWQGDAGVTSKQTQGMEASADEVLALVTAELLCTAASHKESRKALSQSSSSETPNDDGPKIAEIGDGDAQKVQPLLWLAAFVERAELENAPRSSLLAKTALLSALALHKITRISAPSDEATASIASLKESGQNEKEKTEQAQKAKEEDRFLFEMCKRFIVAQHTEASDDLDVLCANKSLSLHQSTLADLQRLCHLSAVEGMTYLATQSLYRDAIADDASVYKGLCTLGKAASSAKDVKQRYAFPSRATLDSDPSSLPIDGAPDTAMQFAIATLIVTICKYMPVRTKEQKNIDKLQRMANAKGAEEDDVRLATPAVEERITKVIRAGCIDLLTAIALSGSASAITSSKAMSVNPSAGVRQALSEAFLSMTTKQDKRQRGVIIQQGGAKALAALCNYELGLLLQDDKQASKSFTSNQALAHLLISENPRIVLSDPTDAILSLSIMYMHSSANRLQQFEAALALTNVASLEERLAQRVAQCSFPRSTVIATSSDDFVGANRPSGDSKISLADMIYERIMHEDHDMSRRASVELLCNLLTCDGVFRQWAGEVEDEKRAVKADAKELSKGQAGRGLMVLALLCAPGGRSNEGDGDSAETALKTRMAAGGAIAMLCSSPSACSRILEAEPRVLHRICTLVDPNTRPRQAQIVEISDDDEDTRGASEDAGDDVKRDEEDCASEAVHGPVFARWQLALRGITALGCLLQYVQWLQANKDRSGTDVEDTSRYLGKFAQAGASDAIQAVARNGAQVLKASNQASAAVQSTVMDVTKQALELLRICQQMNLLER